MQKQKFVAGFASVTALSALLLVGNALPGMSAPGQQPYYTGRDVAPAQIVISLNKNGDRSEMMKALQEVNGHVVDVSSAGDLSFALIQVDQPDKNFNKAFSALSKNKQLFKSVQMNNHYYPERIVRPTRPTRPPTRPPVTPPTKPPVTPPVTPPSSNNWPASGSPNDPNLGQQSQIGIHNVVKGQNAIAAKGKALPSSAVKIGIVDTGVQGNIAAFASGQVLPGMNAWSTTKFGNVDSDTGGIGGHGTFCASLMAGKTNDSSQGAGILPGATIVPVDCFNGQSSTDTFHIIKGIQYLQGQGVRFVNLSVNGSASNGTTLNADSSYQAACAAFNSATDGTVFNAAGNDGGTDNSAVVPGNVCVAAVNSTRAVASFSVRGSAVQFAGAGVSDGSTNKSAKFVVGDGTSFATPSCCAIAASIQYVNPSASLASILSTMKTNANTSTTLNFPVPDMEACIKAQP